jgi:ATP/ADP translocase
MQHCTTRSHDVLDDADSTSTAWLLQLKGKAAIDVICNPLGKSGGALIQQFMIISFGSLAASTPYLGGILLVIVLLWLNSARSLDKQFTGARGCWPVQTVLMPHARWC